MSEASPVERRARPSHWKDDRGHVITDAYRNEGGSDWQHYYNVPCRMVFGRVMPLHKCNHCGGNGRDPEASYDPCPTCGKSGGLPSPNTLAETRQTAHKGTP
jgi:hypothetical protein